ncbi:MAG: NAD(P)H nitroreductase [Pseudonocardia sp.]|nr:NAD(P)H nitroreductase [Pseudonocardia sp.]
MGSSSEILTGREPAAPGLTRLMRAAVELATRAPSVHNTQPWRWRIEDDRVELHADRNRQLTQTDPDGRDLMISCGCALHHLDVAVAGMGLGTTIERFPDPENRDHLATVRIRSDRPDRAESALFSAIGRRRTDRRPYGPGTVAPASITALVARAHRRGAGLHPVVHADARARLDAVLADAADAQRHQPGYVAELLTWTRRYAGSHDGVPPASIPNRPPYQRDAWNRFPPGRLATPLRHLSDDGMLVAVTTEDDGGLARLVAGEATSAILLAATRAGLASAPLSQALELPQTRDRLARNALHIPDHPQMVVRIGHPPDDTELPETPRRPLSAVLMAPR